MKTNILQWCIFMLLNFYATSLTLAQQHYNVLFIAVDDMTDRSSLFGYNEVYSPNISRLAQHGMLFTRAYTQFPMCNASRTSLLTGWRPDKTGVKYNSVEPRSVLGPDVVFLPEYFKKNGYRTERYGKILHSKFESDITWDYAEPEESSEGKVFNPEINPDQESSSVTWWVNNVEDTMIEDGKVANHLVATMQNQLHQPFFYGLGFTSTHLPFSPNLSYWNKNGDKSSQQLLKTDKTGSFKNLQGTGSSNISLPATPEGDRNDIPPVAIIPPILFDTTEWQNLIHAYEGEVSMVDFQLGLVLDEMDRQNLWSNTVVVFWSDHGQHLGEHEGLWRKNTLFEESLHIPLIVCVPGKKSGVCPKLVELVDLYPTLTELCGLPAPEGMEGSSFAPLLDNPQFNWKPAVFSQVSLGKADLGRSVTTIYGRYNSWGAEGEELYDHGNDPKEYTNLIGNPEDSSMANEMRTLLAEGWQNALPPVYKKTVWYRDADKDGYGAGADSIFAYWNTEGYVNNKSDCDDNDNTVYPGAIETCDGKDNNCNGIIDEGCLPSLSISDRSFPEGNNSTKKVAFNISLSYAATSPVKVNLSTADSTALAGEDYLGGSTIVNFKPGETLKTVRVSIIGDTKAEPTEIFKIYLTSPVNASISKGSANAVIRNDDNNPIASPAQLIAENITPGSSSANSVWPNPAKNFINILLNESVSNAGIVLTDAYGSVIKKWNVFNFSDKFITRLEVNDVANGVYFLRIQPNSGNSFTKKIIILH